MRYIVYLLLLANVAFFAWHWYAPAPPEEAPVFPLGLQPYPELPAEVEGERWLGEPLERSAKLPVCRPLRPAVAAPGGVCVQPSLVDRTRLRGPLLHLSAVTLHVSSRATSGPACAALDGGAT